MLTKLEVTIREELVTICKQLVSGGEFATLDAAVDWLIEKSLVFEDTKVRIGKALLKIGWSSTSVKKTLWLIPGGTRYTRSALHRLAIDDDDEPDAKKPKARTKT